MGTPRAWCHVLVVLLVVAVTGCAPARRAPDAGPSLEGYTLPPDWAPHEAVWFGWSDNPRQQAVQLEMIRAMVPHVGIRLMIATDSARRPALEALAAAGIGRERIELVTHPLANVWVRDSGPRFLTNGRGLAMADFAWNGYGYPRELLVATPYVLRRREIARDVAAGLGLPVVSTDVIGEGGALEVSDSVILSYRATALQRNPERSLEEIEREYLRVYGKKKVVWLDRAPLADRVFSGPKLKNYFGLGANGHIDEYARFVDNSTIVVARIAADEADGDPISQVDHEILEENAAQLRAAVDAEGRPFRVVPLPMPALRHHLQTAPLTASQKQRDSMDAWYRDFRVGDEIHWMPAVSYLNFVVTNGVVLVPAYWRPGLPDREREKDAFVRDTLQRLFPDRRVVALNPLEVNRIGGGMHCITQQQPRVP
jgi:agmatine deiminase